LAKKKAELSKLAEELSLFKKHVEKQASKLHEKTTGSASGSSREAELENELKLTMVPPFLLGDTFSDEL
jgi:hypothetical protein